MRPRKKAGIVCALLVALITLTGLPAPAAETFTVDDVPIDVTAQSAAAARDKAIADVQRKAFTKLIKQLVANPADQARLSPSQSQIETFVQDFTVESERTSPVRYIGRYSVRFRAGPVRQYLADQGIAAVTAIPQVLVLPLYKGATGPVLWGQGNPWRGAWDVGGFGQGPASIILPNGDSYDKAVLSAGAAETGDPNALEQLIVKYHAAGAVVAEVAAPAPSSPGLSIAVTSYDLTGVKGSQTVTVDPVPGEQPDKTYRRGVVAVGQALAASWQQSVTSSGSIGLAGEPPQTAPGEPGMDGMGAGGAFTGAPGTLYPIQMPIDGIADWVSARAQLAVIPGVQHISVDALTRGAVAFTLDFAGDILALQTVLASSGFMLSQPPPTAASPSQAYALRRAQPIAQSATP